MKIVKLPFKAEFERRMLDGVKTCTTRGGKYAVVGDEFEAFGAWFKFTEVKRMKLSEVTRYYHKDEGFETSVEFVECWKSIHGNNGYLPMKMVWVYHFERIS